MRVVIGYESMYGNTHHVAVAIGTGFDPADEVLVRPVDRIPEDLEGVDLLIVGSPTHAHALPRPASRRAAIEGIDRPDDHHRADSGAAIDTGVREWLERLPGGLICSVAAFDTRFRPPAWVVGHPARRISRTLARHGGRVISRPESFLVDKHEDLVVGELERARLWGQHLRSLVAAAPARSAS